MRTGTTRAVGLVVSDFSNPLFSAIAKGADTVLSPNGYSLVLANSMSDGVRESEAIAALRQRRVDGLIAAVADEDAPGLADRLGTFSASVLVDREVPGSTSDSFARSTLPGWRRRSGISLFSATAGSLSSQAGSVSSAAAPASRRISPRRQPGLAEDERLPRDR